MIDQCARLQLHADELAGLNATIVRHAHNEVFAINVCFRTVDPEAGAYQKRGCFGVADGRRRESE